jgi:hypothetical protein
VLFVYSDQAYEIVADGGDDVVVLPQVDPTVWPNDPLIETAEPSIVFDNTPPDDGPDNMIASSPLPDTAKPDNDFSAWLVILVVLGVPSLVGLGIWIGRRGSE